MSAMLLTTQQTLVLRKIAEASPRAVPTVELIANGSMGKLAIEQILVSLRGRGLVCQRGAVVSRVVWSPTQFGKRLAKEAP